MSSERARGKRPQQDVSESESDTQEQDRSPTHAKRPKNGEREIENDSMEEEDDVEPVKQAIFTPRAEPLVRDEDGFITGSIVRVKCKQFLTYVKMEFFPGSDLNMIIGPNGSGKSAIVCAIALGLGFPPASLGRQKKPKDYIRTGCREAEIEIELKGPYNEPNVVINRVLRDDKPGQFTIDGKSATGKEVSLKMQELNIQVNNLCTFLPQDRVGKFAEMSGPDLLKETQRAAGGAKLTEWHESLIKESTNVKELASNYEASKKYLENLREKTAGSEKDVKAYEEQEKIANDVAVLEGVILYARDDAKVDEHQSSAAALTALIGELTGLEEANKPFVDSRNSLKNIVARLGQQKEVISKRTSTAVRDVTKAKVQFKNNESTTQNLLLKLEDLTSAAIKRKKTIQEMKDKIEKMQKVVDKKPPPPDVAAFTLRKSALNKSRADVDNELRELNQEIAPKTRQVLRVTEQLDRVNHQLKALENVAEVQKRLLYETERTAYDAQQWLDAHRADFKGKVFNPVRMEISVKNPKLADLAEGPITRASAATIIFALQEDYELMTREYIDKRKGSFNGAQLPEGKTLQTFIDQRERMLAGKNITKAQIESWGFDCWANELINGPDAVLAFLCETNKLHLTPVCTTSRAVDVREIERLKLFTKYYTLDGSHSVKYSAYGRQGSQNEMRPLSNAFYLGRTTAGVDQVQALRVERSELVERRTLALDENSKLVDKKNQLESKMRGFKGVQDKIEADYKAVFEPFNNWKKVSNRLGLEKEGLKAEEAKPVKDSASIRAALKDQTDERVKFMVTHQNALGKQILVFVQATNHALESLQASTDLKAMDRSAEENSESIKSKREEVDAAKNVKKMLFVEVQKLRGTLENWNSENVSLREQVDAKCAEGLTLAVLEDELNLNKARRDGLPQVEKSVIDLHKKRLLEIKEEEKKVSNASAKLLTCQGKISAVRDLWFPALQQLVSSISARFTRSFDSLGRLGEVAISENEDYAKWSIDILCSFRKDEAVQKLTASRQSGGERGLATIVYLLALAELGKAPFSLVDEINQGMDPQTERQVHNMLVNVTSSDDVGQYFLITPKLLTDLEYTRNMKVLVIHNGSWIPEELNLQDVLKKKQSRLAAQAKRKAT